MESIYGAKATATGIRVLNRTIAHAKRDEESRGKDHSRWISSLERSLAALNERQRKLSESADLSE